MMGLSKLGTAITAITAVTFLALVAEIVYVLWQRRRRLRPPARVEPQEVSSPPCSSSSPSSSPAQAETELDLELEQHVTKWQCLHGPSRALFTIKEEEREGLESDNGSSADCSAVLVMKSTSARSASLSETVAVVVEGLLNETTPFSTPCASPPYYTPFSSPGRSP